MCNMIVLGNWAKYTLQNAMEALLMIQKQTASLLLYFFGIARFSSQPLPHCDKIRHQQLLKVSLVARSKLLEQSCNMWQKLPTSDGVFRISFRLIYEEMCVSVSHYWTVWTLVTKICLALSYIIHNFPSFSCRLNTVSLLFTLYVI